MLLHFIKLVLCVLVLFHTCEVLCHQEDDFCDRDEKTGACKSRTSSAAEEEEAEDEPCFEKEEEPTAKPKREIQNLVRLDGVKVGHVQYREIQGKTYKLITRALRPLLFEIPNFITEEEADIIKAQAELTGLFSSIAKGGLTAPDLYRPVSASGRSLGPSGNFSFWDWNDDGIIDMEDILSWGRYESFLVLNETDVTDMFKAIEDHTFDDGIITKEEFETLNTQGVDDYLNLLIRQHPRFRQRFSEQCFLSLSKLRSESGHLIRERVVELTKLPRKVIYQGEHLQVVRYDVNGHYHAHHDSETHTRSDKPCCHLTDTETVLTYGACRLCRFVTIMFYLNDVEEGGETAFPAADNATYSEELLRYRGKDADDVKDSYNLSNHCKDANLLVKPRFGTAVMWYNHFVNPENGWMGEMEERALHGGCDVKKGEKWIANMWLTAPYLVSDAISMYYDEEDYLLAEKAYS